MIRRVTLVEVMSEVSNRQRSVSHLNWSSHLGFDEAGHYAIETVEGRRLAFDVTSEIWYQFPWRRDGGTFSTNLNVIRGTSAIES